jgi:hypothetical protein
MAYAFDQPVDDIGHQGNRRAVLQGFGVSALGTRTGFAGANTASGKKGKKGKKKRKQGMPQDLVACQDVVLRRCLIGDTVCIAAGTQCCDQLVAGRTGDAVTCLVNFAADRVR